jgi:2',3'-cyclic-nucleotide 2'-phosphodiesterase (5'-nucleotidase family)
MKLRMRFATILAAATVAALAFGQAAEGPEVGAHGPSQAAADVLRDHAGTDGAFLAAGLVRDSFQRDNLATLLQFPSDEVVIVSLTGGQIRQAFERSLSLLPQPNTSFLQISGFEVVFNRNAPPNSRVVSVTADGAPLQDGRTYTVAMPANLGRGGLGYFKIWDRGKITRTLEGVTMEGILKGRRHVETSPRWVPQG